MDTAHLRFVPKHFMVVVHDIWTEPGRVSKDDVLPRNWHGVRMGSKYLDVGLTRWTIFVVFCVGVLDRTHRR